MDGTGRRHRTLAWLAGVLLFALALAAHATGLAPRVHQGTLDLTAPGAADRLHELRGDWGFAWHRFRDPEHPSLPDATAPVPASWNDVTADGKPSGPDGWGTYVLEVRCPEGRQLALMMPAQRTAMRLYVNGRLAATQGTPGTSPADGWAAIGRRAELTEPFACPLQITVHLSSYEHRAGGMVRAPVIGPPELLAREYNQWMALDTLLVGAYLMLGLAPVIFWLGRPKDKAPLYTGLFCLAQMFYADMTGERLLLQLASPQTPWDAYLRTEYLAWFVSMALFPLMVDGLFPRMLQPRAVRLVLALCGLGALVTAVTPARVFSGGVFYGIAVGLGLGTWVGLLLVRATRQGRTDAGVLLAGMGFLSLVLLANLVEFSTGLALRSLSTFGQLAFVLSGPMVLLRRLARALTTEELRSTEQREKADLLVRTTQAGILDWDCTHDVTRYSPRLLEILGYPPATESDTLPTFFEHVHPDDRTEVQELFLAQLHDRSVSEGEMRHAPYEYRLLTRTGGIVWVHAEAISIRGRGGRVLRYICSILDITGHRQLAERLQRQNAALAENARLREDVERMSRHDLKTPLNSVIGVARLLREDPQLPEEQRELLAISERAGYRILEMVNRSLDLSRMELGTYEFRPQAVNLLDVLSRVLLDLHTLAGSAQVQVRLEGEFSVPVYARAEELLCYSIFANLLKNAIEATPRGGTVTLGISPGEMLQVWVHNPGKVPAEVAGRFFDKYVTAGKGGGTGLGTYSARLMARVQEGELTMATGAEGTRLTLTLRGLGAEPLPAAGAPGVVPAAPEAAVLADFEPRRVLLADDDEYNRLVLLRYLPSPPFTVDVAGDGLAAIEAVNRHWPDFVLIDMEMPGRNGLETVAWIRAEEERQRRRPCHVLMMSSNDDPVSIRRGLEAGANRYLAKPFTREALWATMLELDTGVPSAPTPLDGRDSRKHLAGEDQPPAQPEARVRVDAELLHEVPAFLASRRAMVSAMAEALEQGEREQLRLVAHRAAGGLALFGFQWAAWQSRRISQRATEGDAGALEHEIRRLREHLQTVQVQ